MIKEIEEVETKDAKVIILTGFIKFAYENCPYLAIVNKKISIINCHQCSYENCNNLDLLKKYKKGNNA